MDNNGPNHGPSCHSIVQLCIKVYKCIKCIFTLLTQNW